MVKQLLDRFFPRKYGIKSLDTDSMGTEGFPFRTPWTPAYQCVKFEFIAANAGIKTKGWKVVYRGE